MGMADILMAKGIDINENCCWKDEFHPARNGKPRYGRIRKAMKIYSSSSRKGDNYSIVGLTINTITEEIEVNYLDGTMPLFKNLCWAILSDRDVRRLIVEYQKCIRLTPYKIWKEKGLFGGTDICMAFGYEDGGFMRTKTRFICHISSDGRYDNSFKYPYDSRITIGDFVEIAKFMGFTDEMDRKALRIKAGMKYILPSYEEELRFFTTEVSKIL